MNRPMIHSRVPVPSETEHPGMHISLGQLIHRQYDEVYISPHLDDVVFSCGGRILRRVANRQSCLVITVFTGEPDDVTKIPAEVHARIGDMTIRRDEDRRAMKHIGADFLWLDYEEAIYRHPVYYTVVGTFSRYRASDRRLAQRLADQVAEIARQVRARCLYFPLGVGSHVDHRVICDAGVHLSHQAERPWDIFFYEDAPYAFIPHLVEHRMRMVGARSETGEAENQKSLWSKAHEAYARMMSLPSVRAQVGTPILRGLAFGFIFSRFLLDTYRRPRRQLVLSADVCDISEVFPTKLAAVAAYSSQIQNVLGDLEVFQRLQHAYSRDLGHTGLVERVWRVMG